MNQEFWDEITGKILTYSELHNAKITIPRYLAGFSSLYKLTAHQYNVLALCHNLGPQSISDIAQKLHMHHSCASRIVAELVKRNLAKRFKSTENKSKVYVDLTEVARENFNKRQACIQENLESNLKRILDDEGLEKFNDAYDYLISVYRQFQSTEGKDTLREMES